MNTIFSYFLIFLSLAFLFMGADYYFQSENDSDEMHNISSKVENNAFIDTTYLLSNSLVEHPVSENILVDTKEYQGIMASFLFDVFYLEKDIEADISDLLVSLYDISHEVDLPVSKDTLRIQQADIAPVFSEEKSSTTLIRDLDISEIVTHLVLEDTYEDKENILKNTLGPVLQVVENPVGIEERSEDIVIISRKPQLETEALTVTENTPEPHIQAVEAPVETEERSEDIVVISLKPQEEPEPPSAPEDTVQMIGVTQEIEEIPTSVGDEQIDVIDEVMYSGNNRIVIPKINKDIPLIDIQNKEASSSAEWNDIMLQELENGVVKYPGSAYPGEVGNSFIFGHSSNFSWAEGLYNDVFAQLGELRKEDEIIIYFEQKKYIYRVINTQVVRPGYVDNSDNEGKKLLTLMTCWPVGTTLNRLLIRGELVDS